MPAANCGVNHALFLFLHLTRHLSGARLLIKNLWLAGFSFVRLSGRLLIVLERLRAQALK